MQDIKYVQLEPTAFLADIDFQLMTAEERGVYCSIIFYLYANGGKLELTNSDITLLEDGSSKLAAISGCYKCGAEWQAIWSKLSRKFIIENNLLMHKRVNEELARAKNRYEAKSRAGKAGMASRYSSDNSVITKIRKEKISKEKNNYFDQFWESYPRKVGKTKCREKFDSLKVNEELLERMLTTIKRFKLTEQWRREDGKYIPHPLTWLNRGGWDDEPTTGIAPSDKRTELKPLAGKTCGKGGCKQPAVYRDTSGQYDHYYCREHLPEKVREHYK